MGTPEFAVPPLEAIVGYGHEVVAVYSQPPKPAGRGYQVIKSPVHQKAEELGIPVFTPNSLKDPEAQAVFAGHQADLAVVAAYGKILPKAILEAPRFGCFNIHASLLPRWRGAAPIQRAILAGDNETGVTIMHMNEGLDTGNTLLADRILITPSTTASELHDRLSLMGASLIIDTLEDLEKGILDPQPQPEAGVTYAEKLSKDEGLFSWSEPAMEIERKIRALNPWPGVYFRLNEKNIKILEAEVAHLNLKGKPGEVLDDQLTIACGTDSLRILRLQQAGGKALSAREFLNGHKIKSGDKF